MPIFKDETVIVPKEWFRKLIHTKRKAINQLIEKEVSPKGLEWVRHLLDYIEDSNEEFFINIDNEQ